MSHIHIDMENLSFSYKDNKKVLDGINLNAREKDSIGIIGANGAGKSTLLKLLVGLDLGFEGSVRVEEIPLEKKTLSRIREKIGFVFQEADNQLFMNTVGQDVAFGPINYGLGKEEVENRVSKALERTGITHLKDKYNHELSGGEKKLASIATILSMNIDIILMDEPSASLDPKNRRNLISILNGFDHLKIITSHDLDFVWDTCNRVLVLNEGKIVADGTPDEILRNKKLLEENGLELPLSLTERK
ncbi:MAG: energy-coupling factor ABC transporter ATP-binding protein [Spirochaetales bacterium]|nr:energy-coupling factor ABC transporter ATP-binding protein [Spirochaetales bacterium]